jgi:hypothetical protein
VRARCILSILLAVVIAQGRAAGGPAAGDVADADRLFNEGRALLADGKRTEACAKFDESFRKDPRAVGTMLNLGLCREEAGQVASAVRLYGEARDRAHDQNLSEHEEAATRKIMLLRPRVPRIQVKLPVGLGAAARVLIDDIVFTPDEIDAIELDPGEHRLVVTAPGKLPYETKLTLAESEHPKIEIPPLAGATTVVVAPTNRRALWGKIATAGGVLIAGGGLGIALLARSQYWHEFPAGSRDGTAVMDATHDCWTSVVNGRIVRECNTRGREATRSAHTLSHVGLGTLIAGGVIAIGGAVLWVTAPHNEPTPAVSLDVGRDHAGLAFTGSF